jgi:DNA-binding protein HU-beta
MNKGDLVNEVVKLVSTKKEAQAAVDCVFAAVTQALKKKGAVTLVGFGTFKVEKGKKSTNRCRDQDQGQECAQVRGRQSIKGCGELIPLKRFSKRPPSSTLYWMEAFFSPL